MGDDYLVILVIDDDELDGLLCVCLWILTPYCMCMVCVYVFFMYGVSDVVKEGSHNHLLVGIYTMHHFLPLPV